MVRSHHSVAAAEGASRAVNDPKSVKVSTETVVHGRHSKSGDRTIPRIIRELENGFIPVLLPCSFFLVQMNASLL